MEILSQGLDEGDLKKGILSAIKKLHGDSAMFSKKKNKSFCEDLIMLLVDYFCIGQSLPLNEVLLYVEKAAILTALAKANGNQKDAALSLGMKYTTLFEKIRRYNINVRKKTVFDIIYDEAAQH